VVAVAERILDYAEPRLGALAINTAGNREETVNYLVNGVTLTE